MSLEDGKTINTDLKESLKIKSKEQLDFKSTFYRLSREYGVDGVERILNYIDVNADVGRIVVSNWLNNVHIPSDSIQRKILGCLSEFDLKKLAPQKITAIKEKFISPDLVKKFIIQPEPEVKPIPVQEIKKDSEIKPEQKEENKPEPRKRALKEWEFPGRYENLNIYESDLLDYLKNTFGDSEFNVKDIKFPQKRARGHTYFFQHLHYFINKGYLEKEFIRDGRYLYKIKQSKV
jgi:hypothetical protein